MNKLFATYEIAFELKELGFDEPCLCTYGKSDKRFMRNPGTNILEEPIEDDPYYWINSKIHESVISAPLWQQIIDWFRETYNMDIIISSNILGYGFVIYYRYSSKNVFDNTEFQYYTEARMAAILKAIELIKSKTQ